MTLNKVRCRSTELRELVLKNLLSNVKPRNIFRSDVKSVIEGLGRSSCILVAHDWGGVVGYYFTAQWPSMVQQFMAVNIPHPLSIRREQAKSWKQRLMSWYMLFFQCPILPELYFQ